MEEIKRIADAALKLQNKDAMDAALREISKLCDLHVEGSKALKRSESVEILANADIDSGEMVTVGGEPAQSSGELISEDCGIGENPDEHISGFGLAPIVKEGCAVHPDKIEGEISDENYKSQSERYMTDTGDFATAFARNEVVTKAMVAKLKKQHAKQVAK